MERPTQGLAQPTLPDHQPIVFARSDDYFIGILHSRIHEVWALRVGTRLETRPRFTPTTCFETFPFPDDSLGGFAASPRDLGRAERVNALMRRVAAAGRWQGA